MVQTDVKITNNTKMNHVMVSFSDHYNSILQTESPTTMKIDSFMIF